MQNPVNVKDTVGDSLIAIWAVVGDAWKHHRGLLVSFLAIAIVTALTPFVVRGAEALLLNQLTSGAALKTISPFVLLLIAASAGIFFLQGSLDALFRYVDKKLWFRFHHRHDVALSEKLATLDVATHEDPKFKDQLQLLQENGEAFAVVRVIDNVAFNVKNGIALITALVIITVADWRFLPLILIASLPGFYADIKYGRKIWNIQQSKSEDRRSYSHVKGQTRSVTGIRELQTFQTIPFFIERQRKLLSDFLVAQLNQDRKLLVLQLCSALLLGGCIFVVLYILVHRVIADDLKIGTFVFVLGAILSFQGAVVGFFSGLAQLRKDARPAKTFFDIMARESHIKRPNKGVKLNLSIAPRIEFKNVYFAYPSSPEINVLENFSLTIESGERMAFVGINGAGKSTLVKLLCRFYDPTSGVVLIDGTDLRDIDLESWYNNLALLAQDYQTYSFKVWEVIGLGRLGQERQQPHIERAAERAQADAFITKWEQTYSTQIGVEFEGGIDPSGGQKQKLSLARTLYRDALVTVLDEPTAHVDAAAEQNIFNHLEKEFPRSRTLLMISHRFSTVRNADRICVIENNQVKELGTHDELLKLGGTYAELFLKQAAAYR